MRKTIVTLVALCAAMTVNATVLRVSNVSGSTAPYSTVQDALSAAAEGDTIMLDASGTSYGYITIEKRVALIGPGYWLQENGIIQEGVEHAVVDGITVKASDVVLSGLFLKGMDCNVNIIKNSKNVVVKRCHIEGCIEIGTNADRCVIHQNLIRMHNNIAEIGGGKSSNHQITNNIITSGFGFNEIHDSYFAYNTILNKGEIGWRLSSTSGITFEKNIWFKQPERSNCNFSDNLELDASFNPTTQTDKDVQALNLSTTHGAFAGDSPYVISGIPSAPVIEDLVVPTTVEYGTKMNVTIKVSVQK